MIICECIRRRIPPEHWRKSTRTLEIVLFSRPQTMLGGWVIRFSWCCYVYTVNILFCLFFFLLHLFYGASSSSSFSFLPLFELWFLHPFVYISAIKLLNQTLKTASLELLHVHTVHTYQSHSAAFNRDSLHSKPLSRFSFSVRKFLATRNQFHRKCLKRNQSMYVTHVFDLIHPIATARFLLSPSL